MYCDDPALMYRTYGVPEVQMTESTSLAMREFGQMGEEEKMRMTGSLNHGDFEEVNHGRRSIMTGDVLTRSKSGIYLDDNMDQR